MKTVLRSRTKRYELSDKLLKHCRTGVIITLNVSSIYIHVSLFLFALMIKCSCNLLNGLLLQVKGILVNHGDNKDE